MVAASIKDYDITGLKEFINDLLELPKGYKIKEIRVIEIEKLDNDNQKKNLYDLEVKDETDNLYIIELRDVDEEETNYLKRIYPNDITYIGQLEESLLRKESLPVVIISLVESKFFTPIVKFHNVTMDEELNNEEDMKDYIFIEFGNFRKQLLTNIDKWRDLFK